MLAIYKREVRSYFNSMIGCVFAAFLTIIGGVYFMVYNLYSGYPFFAYSLAGVIFMLLISVPVLSMKSFAEDRKNKTDQITDRTGRKILQQIVQQIKEKQYCTSSDRCDHRTFCQR